MVIAGIDDEPVFKHNNDGEEDSGAGKSQDMNSTFTVWKRSDTDGGSTEGSNSPGTHPEDVKNRQSVVMKGPRGDHGGEAAASKKPPRKSSYKRVTSVMSSMKKFMVKKVYGTGEVKIDQKKNLAPAQNIQYEEAGEVSHQEAEAAGVPTSASKQENMRKFASFEDQLKQIRMSEEYLQNNPDVAS